MTISSVFQRSLENLGNLLAGGETRRQQVRHTGRFTRREEATYPLSCALPGGQGITDSVLYLSLLVMPLEMSDVDSKSSSGSETKNSSANAGEDSLDFMQRMILVQQQHLISQYQCEKSNTSGVNGKCYASYPAWHWEV